MTKGRDRGRETKQFTDGIVKQFNDKLDKCLKEAKDKFLDEVYPIVQLLVDNSFRYPIVPEVSEEKISTKWLGNLLHNNLTAIVDYSGKLSFKFSPLYKMDVEDSTLDLPHSKSEYDLKAIVGVAELFKVLTRYLQEILNNYAYYKMPSKTGLCIYPYPRPTSKIKESNKTKNCIDYIIEEGLSWIEYIYKTGINKCPNDVDTLTKGSIVLSKILEEGTTEEVILHLWSRMASSNNKKLCLRHYLLGCPIWSTWEDIRELDVSPEHFLYQRGF